MPLRRAIRQLNLRQRPPRGRFGELQLLGATYLPEVDPCDHLVHPVWMNVLLLRVAERMEFRTAKPMVGRSDGAAYERHAGYLPKE